MNEVDLNDETFDNLPRFEPIKTNKRFHYRDGHRKLLPRHRCLRKKSYSTRSEAEKMRIKLLEGGLVTFLRIYKCWLCKLWHLTKQEQKKA